MTELKNKNNVKIEPELCPRCNSVLMKRRINFWCKLCKSVEYTDLGYSERYKRGDTLRSKYKDF